MWEGHWGVLWAQQLGGQKRPSGAEGGAGLGCCWDPADPTGSAPRDGRVLHTVPGTRRNLGRVALFLERDSAAGCPSSPGVSRGNDASPRAGSALHLGDARNSPSGTLVKSLSVEDWRLEAGVPVQLGSYRAV